MRSHQLDDPVFFGVSGSHGGCSAIALLGLRCHPCDAKMKKASHVLVHEFDVIVLMSMRRNAIHNRHHGNTI